ncbi:hypothetical protein Tco_0947682 [Tanacetum coccineum]
MAPGRRPTVNWNPPVNCSTNRNTMDINSGIDAQMLNQLIGTRVAEALADAVEFHAVMQGNFRGTKGAVGLTRWFEKLESQFGISNVAEGDRVKFASSTLLDSALTWWNVYVRSVTLNAAHTTPWNDFKAMFTQKYCPRNEGNVTLSKPVELHEAIEMAQGLMYQVVQDADDTTLTHALLPATTVVGQDIRPRNAELHLVLQAKEDPEPKEDRVVMLLASDAVKRAITRTSA